MFTAPGMSSRVYSASVRVLSTTMLVSASDRFSVRAGARYGVIAPPAQVPVSPIVAYQLLKGCPEARR